MPSRLTETVQRVMGTTPKVLPLVLPVTASQPRITIRGRLVQTDKTKAEKTKIVLQDIAHLMEEHCRTPELRPLYHALRWLQDQVKQGNVPL